MTGDPDHRFFIAVVAVELDLARVGADAADRDGLQIVGDHQVSDRCRQEGVVAADHEVSAIACFLARAAGV